MTTPTAASVEKAQEIVCQMVDDVPYAMLTGQQNKALVQRIAKALDAQREADAKVADYFANNSTTAKYIAKTIREGA